MYSLESPRLYCLFSLESPERGDSNEYTQYTISQYELKDHPKSSKKLQLWDLFQGTQGRVRNSRGKRAISVRATEVLQFLFFLFVDIQITLKIHKITAHEDNKLVVITFVLCRLLYLKG